MSHWLNNGPQLARGQCVAVPITLFYVHNGICIDVHNGIRILGRSGVVTWFT